MHFLDRFATSIPMNTKTEMFILAAELRREEKKKSLISG